MNEILKRLREILAGANTAVLASHRPDGMPQQFVVWAEMDGNDVLMSTTKGRPKFRNLEHDPRVSLTVFPASDPYRNVKVCGTVSLSTEGADTIMERLCQHYRGESWIEPHHLDERVVIRLSYLGPGDD